MDNLVSFSATGKVKTGEKYSNSTRVWFIFVADSDQKEYKVTGSINLDFPIQNGAKYHVEGVLSGEANNQIVTPQKISQITADKRDAFISLFSQEPLNFTKKRLAGPLYDLLGEDAFSQLEDAGFDRVSSFMDKDEYTRFLAEIEKNGNKIEIRRLMAMAGIYQSKASTIIDEEIGPQELINNPFLLGHNIDGYTFNDGLKLSEYLNNVQEAEVYTAGVYFAITETGSTYLPKEELIPILKNKIFNFQVSVLNNVTNTHMWESYIKIVDDDVYVLDLMEAEEIVYDGLMGHNSQSKFKDEIDFTYSILDDQQQEAVLSTFENQITILTGAPGSGKTTVLNHLIKLWPKYRPDNDKVMLLAPTGRAASRMKEVTNRHSQTIHKAILSNDGEDLSKAGLIVIDEMSMIDVQIFAKFFESLSDNVHLLFIGDEDQLPSVQPGNVFHDMIASKKFSTIRLVNNHRQDDGSNIPIVFKNINDGKFEIPESVDDVSFIASNKNDFVEDTINTIKAMLKNGVGPQTIQVITPKNDWAYTLNRELHPLFNEHADQLNTRSLQIGDRVIVNKNLDVKNLSNGDIGYIVDVDDRNLIVDFNGQEKQFEYEDRRYLDLAYALTVHKAQGGEFDNVIIVIPFMVKDLVNRRLLYTGVSRAKETLTFIGDLKALEKGTYNTSKKRKTSLF